MGDIVTLENSSSAIQAGYGGTGAQIRIDSVASGGQLRTSGLTIINGGYGYDNSGNSIYRVIGGTGSGARLTPVSVGSTPAVAAAATAVVTNGSITSLTLTNGGSGYLTTPTVVISDDVQYRDTTLASPAVGIASIRRVGNNEFTVGNDVVSAILLEDAGRGYSSQPTVTISDPPVISAQGNFIFNEIVEGSRSKLQARVKEWDRDTAVLKVANIGIGATTADSFFPGETIRGIDSGASWMVQVYTHDDTYDKYTENDEFETLGDNLLDFTETNPFGTF